VKFKRPKRAALLLAMAVLLFVCVVRWLNPDFLDQLECKTYDLRVRAARKYPTPVVTNLAFVAMENSSIKAIRNGQLLGLPYGYGLYWPRHIYGRVVDELATEGAQSIAFDVLFGELRPDHAAVPMADGSMMESDDFFGLQLRHASNVITAFTPETVPPDLFATNSFSLGDISTDRDSDGVLRRVKCFNLEWHPVFKSAAHQFGVDLQHAQILPDKIILPLPDTNLTVKLDRDGNFDLADFVGDGIPKGFKRYDKPFVRVWDLGIVMAAEELKLDLEHAVVDLPQGKIILHGPGGLERILPVDSKGFFYINWQVTPEDPRLTRVPIESVLQQYMARLHDETNQLVNNFRGRLVVIGSAAQGNDLSDRGATPLEKETLLVSKHWNVANSVIMGQFIHRAALPLELALIIVLGVLTALLTWQFRAVTASLAVLGLLVAYVAVAFVLLIKLHWWLPLFYPLFGAVGLQHFILVVHRVVFEEREKRRVRSVFSRLVSPNVVNELLAADRLALGGARCEVTVFFADIRGFTALTDQAQEQIAEFVRQSDVDLAKVEGYFEESSREMLETVNLYLAAVADIIKHRGGTLDKYIGDCVMAFWNAPTPSDKHALACVEAAIDAQRAIQVLNEQRLAQNGAREQDNRQRLAAGLPPRPLHVALQLGTGINTGFVTAGLMGSDQHILNFTVFGREVNLASRLESHSGSGRIIISDTTYNHLLRVSPSLAAQCAELFPVTPKGFTNPVRIYEVPWQLNK